MKRFLMATMFTTLAASAVAEPVIVPSQGTVPETIERLKTSVAAAGGRVLGVVDFGGVVGSIGEDVGEVQLLLFGDPQIGALALSADRMAALDLPGKVLVYDTAEGAAMAYQPPAESLAEWNIPGDAPVLEMMSRALEAVTSAAAK